jgi:hypothetical protein
VAERTGARVLHRNRIAAKAARRTLPGFSRGLLVGLPPLMHEKPEKKRRCASRTAVLLRHPAMMPRQLPDESTTLNRERFCARITD